MRRILIGLAAAGLLLVTGCSDSDDDTGSTGGESGGESSGGGTTEEFCTEFQALDDQFSQDPEAASDPAQVIEALEGLDPPEEIADDFETVLEVSRQTADVDIEDPDAVAEAQELGESATEANERVSTFLQEECGIESGSGSEDTSTSETTEG